LTLDPEEHRAGEHRASEHRAGGHKGRERRAGGHEGTHSFLATDEHRLLIKKLSKREKIKHDPERTQGISTKTAKIFRNRTRMARIRRIGAERDIN